MALSRRLIMLNSTGCFPTKIRLLASTVMTSRSSSARIALALACGRFTSTPWVSIGAVTMKMMRRTSITSTRGVTLISAIIRRSPLLLPVKAIALYLVDVALQEIEKLDGEAVEPGRDRPDPVQEIVVGHDRRDRRRQPRGRRDQRLRDAGGHRGQRRAPRGGDPREGAHDPPDGPEQADERRRACGGGWEGKVGLHGGGLLVGGLPHRTFDVFHRKRAGARSHAGGFRCAAALDPRQLQVSRPEDLGHRGARRLLREVEQVGEAFPFREGFGELGLVPFDSLEQLELHDDDRPGDDGEDDQQKENELHDRAGEQDVLEHPGVQDSRSRRNDRHRHSEIWHQIANLPTDNNSPIYRKSPPGSTSLTFPPWKNRIPS